MSCVSHFQKINSILWYIWSQTLFYLSYYYIGMHSKTIWRMQMHSGQNLLPLSSFSLHWVQGNYSSCHIFYYTLQVGFVIVQFHTIAPSPKKKRKRDGSRNLNGLEVHGTLYNNVVRHQVTCKSLDRSFTLSSESFFSYEKIPTKLLTKHWNITIWKRRKNGRQGSN